MKNNLILYLVILIFGIDKNAPLFFQLLKFNYQFFVF